MATSSLLIQEIIIQIHSRKLLLHSPLYQIPNSSTPPTSSPSNDSTSSPDNGFDANVVMVLSVLLCALICSLGLNSIIRCALRCSSLVSSESANSYSARLANTGIKKKALKTFPIVNYTNGLELPGLDSECAICLLEFAFGEKVKVLPKCNHGFHVRCIDKWLTSHSSCPTCRNCLIETCQKIVGCGQADSSDQLPQTAFVRPVPLEREGFVHSYQIN